MSDSKSPAFRFYVADFVMGTATMSNAKAGSYVFMLCHQWDNGFVPDDLKELSQIGRCSKEIAQSLLASKFPKWEDGKHRNQRLERERVKQAKYSESQAIKGAAGAKKKWENHSPCHAPAMPAAITEPCPQDGLSFPLSSSSTKNKYPTLDEVKLACAKSGIPDSDAEWFFHKCEGNGWTNDGKPIKKWLSTIIAWKNANYLPSQKAKQNASNPRRTNSAAYSGSVEDNPRNAGTCKPVTDYAAEAAKRQQQQRDRIENAEMARQVAANEPEPPATKGNG